MKSTTLAIIATILPAQMAFAGDRAENEIDALEALNNKGYVDLGIEESKDAIVVFGYKKGKRVALTYTKGDFDLVGKRVTKVNPRNVASDDKPRGDIARAEADTEAARAALAHAREEGFGPQDIEEAEIALEEAEAEEEGIRADNAVMAKKKPTEASDAKPDRRKKAAKKKKRAKAVKGDIARAERDTEEARENLAHAREEGYGPQDLEEAEAALEEAEAEEEGIRADNAKAAKKKAANKKAKAAKRYAEFKKAQASKKKAKGDIERAERDTEEARENLAHAREEGYGPQDIEEAETALEEAEAEEEGIRADNAK